MMHQNRMFLAILCAYSEKCVPFSRIVAAGLIMVQCGYRLALPGQHVDAATLGEHGTYPSSGIGIGLTHPGGLDHRSKEGDQGLLHVPMLVLEIGRAHV